MLTKQIELETKHFETVQATTKLEEVKLKRGRIFRREENESLSRNSSVSSLLSIHEDRPVATSEAAEIKHTRNTKVSPTKQRTRTEVFTS